MEQALGDGYSLTLRKVQKNNGLILDGLCIAKGNGTIAPSIYLNSCYEQYLNGTSMEEIIQKLLTAYYESSWPPILNKLVLSDYDSLRSHIAFRLINASSNQSLLKTMPHIPWMDLAIVFYLYIQENENGIMTAAISDHHMKTWGVTVHDLYHDSLLNTPGFFLLLYPAWPVSWSPLIPNTCNISQLSRKLLFMFSPTRMGSMALPASFTKML